MKKKMILIILGVLIIGGGAWYVWNWLTDKTVCTMDVKKCLDGSYVGRTSPFCRFKKCPEVDDKENLEKAQKPNEYLFSVNGSLLIYSPKSKVNSLHGKGFEPLVWYLVGVNEEIDSNINLKLFFDESTSCSWPGSIYTKELCLSTNLKWGYSDRVRILGIKENNTVRVKIMEIVSALPIEQW